MHRTVRFGLFEWDEDKDHQNQKKHGISFQDAVQVFADDDRIIRQDSQHSEVEIRWLCIGTVSGHVLTVRYTHRGFWMRIIGAGFWRKGVKEYEEKNQTGIKWRTKINLMVLRWKIMRMPPICVSLLRQRLPAY